MNECSHQLAQSGRHTTFSNCLAALQLFERFVCEWTLNLCGTTASAWKAFYSGGVCPRELPEWIGNHREAFSFGTGEDACPPRCAHEM